jgi:hypothetical protein
MSLRGSLTRTFPGAQLLENEQFIYLENNLQYLWWPQMCQDQTCATDLLGTVIE